MAHAKTTPGQVAAQLAAGAVAFGVLYKTFYGEKEGAKPSLANPSGAPAPAASTQQAGSAQQLAAALDAEARNTAGKVWAAKAAGVEAEEAARQAAKH